MLRWFLLLCCTTILCAQGDSIRKMMNDSADAWNRGDLPAFASYYEDSPETTFMGKNIVRGGVQAILDRYRKGYPTRDAMGTLTFSEIEVRPLAKGVALVTGKFDLKRNAAGGGAAWGRYTLIVREGPSGWKIIHDHSSAY
ncbi:MAG TPA: DUF4440 domain-containing protein [Candidatus Sulfopaludibacter sp.]|jgi:uncharacterized protein (TIGR02246 family)|nr:DUF4440 domain-containing protein [Candidatus Sulfopaludibacter sp.]